MSVASFRNRVKRRDKKFDKRKNGMRVDAAAKRLATILLNKRGK